MSEGLLPPVVRWRASKTKAFSIRHYIDPDDESRTRCGARMGTTDVSIKYDDDPQCTECMRIFREAKTLSQDPQEEEGDFEAVY